MRKALHVFGAFLDEDVEWMVVNGARELHPAGSTLIEEGVPIHSLMVLLDGQMVVTVKTGGVEKIATLQSGEIVGEISVIDKQPPAATVIAVRDSHVLHVDCEMLERRLEGNAAFAARFYRAIALFLADRLRHTVGRLGYGEVRVEDSVDELNDQSLDQISMAASRFDQMLKRLEKA